MAMKIRLRQQGRVNKLSYRLVLADIRSPRDGKYIESLGWYDPKAKENDASLNEERIAHWIELGAEVSEKAQALIARKAPAAYKIFAQRGAKKTK